MPLPNPNKNEEQNDFISRCVSDDVMKKEFKDNKQRLAVCYSLFKRKNEEKEQITVITKIEDKLNKVESFVDLR